MAVCVEACVGFRVLASWDLAEVESDLFSNGLRIDGERAVPCKTAAGGPLGLAVFVEGIECRRVLLAVGLDSLTFDSSGLLPRSKRRWVSQPTVQRFSVRVSLLPSCGATTMGVWPP